MRTAQSDLMAISEVAFSILAFLFLGCTDGGTDPTEEPDRIDVFWTSGTPGKAIYFPSTCGLTEEGSVFCWKDAKSEPEALAGGLAFKSISMASHWRCAVSVEGDAYCWVLVKNPRR